MVAAGTVAIGVSAAQAATAQAAKTTLALSALSFAQTSVDSSKGPVADDLTWTVTDSNPNANYVAGLVTIRMVDNATGAFLGHEYTLSYSLDNSGYGNGSYVSGTAQESTYNYTFVVPQYANAATTTWEVTKVTIADDQSATATVSVTKLQSLGFGYSIATTAAVDSSGPTVDYVTLQSRAPYASGLRPYVYVGEEAQEVTYDMTVHDSQSGFWKGTLKLAGPGGVSVTSSFAWEKDVNTTAVSCGGLSGGDDRDMQCAVAVTLPANAAAGSWRVASIKLFDNAGAQSITKNPQAQAVTVTSDATLSASGLGISPNLVNNWRDDATTQLTMAVNGVRKGITAVYVDFDSGLCVQHGNVPTANADGTVSVPIEVYQSASSCKVVGIAIVDGAAEVALYGSEYGAPDPALTIQRIPDTTPPVATSVTLDPSTISESQISDSLTVTVHAAVQTAPIDQFSIHLYDADGQEITSEIGGTGQAPDGTVTIFLTLPWWYGNLQPGIYTLGLSLTDSGNLTTSYGIPNDPNSLPMPGGPVTLTITPDS